MSISDTTPISGWGRYPVAAGRVRRSERLERITCGASLSRGLGRSYGDSSLPAGEQDAVAESTLADRFLSFDRQTGLMRAEAGVSLAEMNRLFLPQGWFTPVTPGTQFVTLGGMAAADVHGKNHHVAGCFGEHIQSLKMRVASGDIVECSEASEPELFRATLGGMGLTGHILELSFQMEKTPSPWIYEESERIDNLADFIEGLREAAKDWPFTVGWIDCLKRGKHMGRGLLMKGRWASAEQAPSQPPRPKRGPTMPFDFPSWALNRWSIQAFNAAYYRKQWA